MTAFCDVVGHEIFKVWRQIDRQGNHFAVGSRGGDAFTTIIKSSATDMVLMYAVKTRCWQSLELRCLDGQFPKLPIKRWPVAQGIVPTKSTRGVPHWQCGYSCVSTRKLRATAICFHSLHTRSGHRHAHQLTHCATVRYDTQPWCTYAILHNGACILLLLLLSLMQYNEYYYYVYYVVFSEFSWGQFVQWLCKMCI